MLKTIKHGDKGTDVQIAQCLIGFLPADGEFTADFTAFCCGWQREHGETPDGIIGALTWRQIAENAPVVSTRKNTRTLYAKAAQILVGVTPDGIFGAKTKAAVAAYQAAAGLHVDGVVGVKTWTALICGETKKDVKFTQPPNFKQYDSRWASKMYSNHGDKKQTMKSSACGPTSMADIVAEWWNKSITPYDLAVKSMDWGTRTYDSGTTGTFFKKCADLYKASKYVGGTKSVEAAIECLEAGGYVVVCFGKSKWTNGGHYCCIWAYENGVFKINDPASASAKRATGTYTEVKNARKAFYCFWR